MPSHQDAAKALEALTKYFVLRTHDCGGDPSELRDIYSLRYQIYCLECGFLEASSYPEGIEIDEFDERSAHFSAYNSSQEVAGTARLVLPREGTGFPFHEHCTFFDEFEAPATADSGEVSRLAVRAEYRRRSGDSMAGVNTSHLKGPGVRDSAPGGERRVNAPLLVLGLYRQMYRYSCERGIRYWYAAMEQSLARVLRIYGFRFEAIGPERDYYGPVTPFLGDLRRFEEDLERSNPGLLWWFRSGP